MSEKVKPKTTKEIADEMSHLLLDKCGGDEAAAAKHLGRFLTTHPDFAVEWLVDEIDRLADEAEQQRILDWLRNPSDTPKAVAAIERLLEERNQRTARLRDGDYIQEIQYRALNSRVGDEPETVNEVIFRIGVDAYVDAFRSEFLKDGYREYELEGVLLQAREHWMRVMKRKAV